MFPTAEINRSSISIIKMSFQEGILRSLYLGFHTFDSVSFKQYCERGQEVQGNFLKTPIHNTTTSEHSSSNKQKQLYGSGPFLKI
jgi:hypothetical protein